MPTQGLDMSFDPELLSQQQGLVQKQRLAEMLMQRSMQPQQGSGNGGLLGALPQALGPLLGMYMQKQGLKESQGLHEKYNERMAAGVKDYMGKRMGTPEIPQPADDLGGGPGRPAIPGDPKAAMIEALMSRNPLIRDLGKMDYAQEQKRDEPRVIGPDGLFVPGGGRPNILNRKPAEHAVPDNWETFLPGGATAAGRGVVRMKGADGQPDLYTMEFERGEFRGLKKLDNSPKAANIRIDNPAPVTVTTVAHPTKPGETLQVDARVYKGGAEGSPGVIGQGAKLTQGGAAEQKLQLQRPQAELKVKSVEQNLNRLETALENLHNHPGLGGITGTLMGRTPNVTNKATGAQGQLNSIKSQIFQSSLQAMRAASPTGGAVGNVSDREGDKLERTIAALDQAMGTPEFKGELKKAKIQVRESIKNLREAFENQFGNVQNFIPPSAAGGAGGTPPPPSGFKVDN